jgi:hypothetical protein
MSQSPKDQEVDATVRSAIVRLFGEEAIDRIEVRPAEDSSGEATLSVTIFLREARRRMPGSRLLDAIEEVSTALRETGDYRFPYVTFLAPDYEGAEDIRPAA